MASAIARLLAFTPQLVLRLRALRLSSGGIDLLEVGLERDTFVPRG
jgi:hypothetical protein